MCGNWAQDATKSYTRSEDDQDAQDANLTSLASGCKAGAPDAPYIFADVFAEHLYIFLLLNSFISIYAIFNFYCNIFLLVHAERSLNKVIRYPKHNILVSIKPSQLL